MRGESTTRDMVWERANVARASSIGDSQAQSGLVDLLSQVRACRLCEPDLPYGPRPVVQADPSARILIIGQAPGRKVHHSGRPWDDSSGERLRQWMSIAPDVFYDPRRIAIMPMGFCYPGARAAGHGDRAPMQRCAPTWHAGLLAQLPNLRLTLLIGQFAQAYYLGRRHRTMTETVKDFGSLGPGLLALPHPSWRVTSWMRKNPWFETGILPHLRACIDQALSN